MMMPFVLPEMTLRAAAVTPPTIVPDAPPVMWTPGLFGSAAVPARFGPITLPLTRLPVAAAVSILMPLPTLPEMRLPAPAASPPIVFRGR